MSWGFSDGSETDFTVSADRRSFFLWDGCSAVHRTPASLVSSGHHSVVALGSSLRSLGLR